MKDTNKNCCVTIKMTPKTKYALGLLARSQHRTISSIIRDIVAEKLMRGGGVETCAPKSSLAGETQPLRTLLTEE